MDSAIGLPTHLTTFIDRDADVRALRTLLGQSRLVTITGTGGAGKTRVAAEVTRASLALWPDGVWWIDLTGADDVVGTVIATAELPGLGHPIDVVTSWLASRRALLVLDNCEHLVESSATFCHSVLERCPQVTILATSREPLGIPGEARWPLSTLSDADALQLFEARGRLVRPSFNARPNAATVARICSRLDRLPLAIEMAAARLDVMSESELLQNLNDRFRVLESSTRTVPERQQTMTAAIDWSYRILKDDEARLFRRLAVFQGGFTMEAATTVCGDEAGGAVLPLLARLVQKSMVVADRAGDVTRYSLLESHHAFANRLLAESGEMDLFEHRHFEFFGARRWEPVESANFWHAVGWGREHAADGGLGLALEIADSDFSDQARAKQLILELLETSAPDDVLRARALTMAARLAWRQADHDAAKALAASAVTHARKAGDSNLTARAVAGSGLIHETAGELDKAREMYDASLALLADSLDAELVSDVRNLRGLLAIAEGDSARALEILGPCVEEARRREDKPRLARYLESLANAQLDAGDVDRAAASWKESLSIFRHINDWFGIIWSLVGLALVAFARRQDEGALRLAAAAQRLSREYSLTTWPLRAGQLDGSVRRARERLKGRGDSAWGEGEAMSSSEAIDYALGRALPTEEQLPDAGPLSRREREVVVMIAAGMTNKEIAKRLFIAERTAEGHVERIRNKLGVRSRTEVATWAITHGLKRPLDKAPPTSKV